MVNPAARQLWRLARDFMLRARPEQQERFLRTLH
jgi:hypothetical protein